MNDYYGDETTNFDYLLVGINNGDDYSLYFYDGLVSGVPKGEYFQVVKGKGTVKGVRYLSLTFDPSSWSRVYDYYLGCNGPCYPFEM